MAVLRAANNPPALALGRVPMKLKAANDSLTSPPIYPSQQLRSPAVSSVPVTGSSPPPHATHRVGVPAGSSLCRLLLILVDIIKYVTRDPYHKHPELLESATVTPRCDSENNTGRLCVARAATQAYWVPACLYKATKRYDTWFLAGLAFPSVSTTLSFVTPMWTTLTRVTAERETMRLSTFAGFLCHRLTPTHFVLPFVLSGLFGRKLTVTPLPAV